MGAVATKEEELSMADLQTRVLDRATRIRNGGKEVVVETTEMALWEARLASQLIERWGMISFDDGGEDTSGRQKVRILTPQEVVDRAVETARLAVDAFRRCGWTIAIPSQCDLNDEPMIEGE